MFTCCCLMCLCDVFMLKCMMSYDSFCFVVFPDCVYCVCLTCLCILFVMYCVSFFCVRVFVFVCDVVCLCVFSVD